MIKEKLNDILQPTSMFRFYVCSQYWRWNCRRVEHESSYVKKIANMSKHKLTHLSWRLKHTLAKLQEIRNTFTKVVEIR